MRESLWKVWRVLSRLYRRPRRTLSRTQHKKSGVLEYKDLGMEAVWKIEVEDFPAFIVINHEGQDFYADLATQRPPTLVQVGEKGKK